MFNPNAIGVGAHADGVAVKPFLSAVRRKTPDMDNALTSRTRTGLWLLVGLTIFGLGSRAIAEENAVRLAYKFQASESLHLEYKQDMRMDIRRSENKHKMVSQVIVNKHLRVISVDASGNVLVEPVIDRTRMTSQQDEDSESKFDSAEGPDSCPAEYRPVLANVGKPLVRVQFAPNGKILSASSVIGDTKVAEDFKNDPTLNFLVVLPEQPVRVGDTWKDDFEAIVKLDKTLKQGVKIRREYKLLKVDGAQAEIELKSSCLTPLREPTVEMQISARLLNGKIVFDHQRGQIVSRELLVESQVLNGVGPNTLVNTVMTQTERLVPNPKLAKRDQ